MPEHEVLRRHFEPLPLRRASPQAGGHEVTRVAHVRLYLRFTVLRIHVVSALYLDLGWIHCIWLYLDLKARSSSKLGSSVSALYLEQGWIHSIWVYLCTPSTVSII